MKRTGELLKKAREEKRLSLHEVALFLKINSRVLQAIEDGDQAQLPARTFLRGFIQSYAKFLKLDANAILTVFSEELAPLPNEPLTVVPTSPTSQDSEIVVAPVEKKTEYKKAPAEEKTTDIDIISLEKSILTQSQVAQDKLGLKTIAVSIIGLLLVVVLYFANSVVKKYQREAQLDPLESISVADTDSDLPEELPASPAETAATVVTPNISTDAPIPQEPPPTAAAANVATTEKLPEKTIEKPAEKPTEKVAEISATPTPPPVQKTAVPASPSPNSVETNSNSFLSSFFSQFSVPTKKEEPKPKLPEVSEEKPAEKPVTTQKPVVPPVPVVASTPPVAAPATKPVEKPVVPVPPVAEVKKEDAKPEGKLIEVIVEATDSVEIEYSSAKTSPQKMAMKAEQIHTFKSRSGVRLKISNGGAVNIIMNGRDLGAPGAAGQPIQLTY